MPRVLALVHAWLILDFFGDSRRSGQVGSTLTTTIFGQSFIGLVMAALLLPDPGESYMVAYAAANLSLSTLLIGIGALADPGSMQRTRADDVLVRTSPMGRGAVTLARALHGAFYIALITTGVALPAGILMYWVGGRVWWLVPAYLAVAIALSGLVAATLHVGIAAIGRWLGVARAPLVAGTCRACLLGGGFIGFALCLPLLEKTAADLPIGIVGALAWPPYWGARLLGGGPQAWSFAGTMLGAGLLLFLAATLLERPTRPVARRRSGRPGMLSRLDARLAGHGPLRGVVSFTSTMLYRSANYRAKVLPVFGLPAAMVVLSLWRSDPEEVRMLLGITLQFPAIYLPILVAFLMPSDERGTRWIFATSPAGTGPELARRAALISLVTHVLVPVHVAGLVAMTLLQGPLVAANLAAFSLGVGTLVAWLTLRTLPGVPFTDDDEEATPEVGHLFGLALILAMAGAAFAPLAGGPIGAAGALAVLAAAFALVRRSANSAPA